MSRAAVDTGGTFTDAVIVNENNVAELIKVPSAPSNPEKAFLASISRAENLTHAQHGTTVATNAVLTDQIDKPVLITNKGFEDMLFLGRQNREELYSLSPLPRVSPIPREHVFGVDCRRTPQGDVVTALLPETIEDVSSSATESGVTCAAVCLLNSFAANDDEVKVAHALRPLPVSISSDVLPIMGEYERCIATVVNAGLLNIVGSYIRSIEDKLQKRFDSVSLGILSSNAGTLRPESASRFPIQTLLSGPAGGAAAVEILCRHHEIPRAIGLDMGGTSADICWAQDGNVLPGRELRIGHFLFNLPRVGVETIGAGGGSIVRCERGVIHVGPSSAGANPGPASYQNGGPATVTDCNLILGRIPEMTLSGGIKLSKDAAQDAIRQIAETIGKSVTETAAIALEVVSAKMARQCRATAVAHGNDPSSAVLIPFGGAGGLHTCELADELRITSALLPGGAGVLSAIGIAMSSRKTVAVQTVLLPLKNSTTQAWEDLEKSALREFSETESNRNISWYAHCRYKGQTDTLSIPLSSSGGDSFNTTELTESFHAAHKSQFGYTRDRDIEIKDIRVEVTSDSPAAFMLQSETFSSLSVPGVRVISRSELDDETPGPFILIDQTAAAYIGESWVARPVDGPWGRDILVKKTKT